MSLRPWYNQDANYQTNAKSFMDYLARSNKFLEVLVEDYESFQELVIEELEQVKFNAEMEVEGILLNWLEDGTLARIINDGVLGNKADKSFVNAELEKVYTQLTQTDTQLDHTNDRITKLSTRNLHDIPFNFKDSGSILFTPNTSTLGQASFSSVIRMDDKIENPIDNFYMYWAGHDGGGVRLSTAPHPLGPWTHYPNDSSPLITDKAFNSNVGHISSPDIVYDEANKKFVLFFHHYLEGLQPSLRVESIDGINFSNLVEILPCPNNGSWDGIERSYLRVIIVNGVWHGVYQGRNGALDPHVHTGYITSRDGYSWTRLSHPLWYDNQFTNFTDGFNLQGGIGGSPSLLYYQGQLWNFYANGQNVREIYAAPIIDLYEREVKPIKVMNNPSWSLAGGLESPNFLVYDGTIYMYYNDYQSDGKRRIGVATMKVGI